MAFKNHGFAMIELKCARGKKIALSAHQISFHIMHAELGAPTFILVHYQPPKTTTATKGELLLYAGHQAVDLHHLGVDVPPLDRWPLSHVLWHMMRHRLVHYSP